MPDILNIKRPAVAGDPIYSTIEESTHYSSLHDEDPLYSSIISVPTPQQTVSTSGTANTSSACDDYSSVVLAELPKGNRGTYKLKKAKLPPLVSVKTALPFKAFATSPLEDTTYTTVSNMPKKAGAQSLRRAATSGAILVSGREAWESPPDVTIHSVSYLCNVL